MTIPEKRHRWKHCRLFVLIFVFGIVSLVTGKVYLFGQPKAIETSTVELPKSIPIQGWEESSARTLNDQTPDMPNYLVGREYSYSQNNSLVLRIEARYLKPTNGDVQGLIKTYRPSVKDTEKREIHTIEEVGSFLFITNQNDIQISSCVNPYGDSTVSIRAYQQNRNFQDIRYRLIPWLLGENLKDERCLWTHMSISTENGEPAAMSESIEQAWVEWSRWWSLHLPQIEH